MWREGWINRQVRKIWTLSTKEWRRERRMKEKWSLIPDGEKISSYMVLMSCDEREWNSEMRQRRQENNRWDCTHSVGMPVTELHSESQ
jgi:hypothetical protein